MENMQKSYELTVSNKPKQKPVSGSGLDGYFHSLSNTDFDALCDAVEIVRRETRFYQLRSGNSTASIYLYH